MKANASPGGRPAAALRTAVFLMIGGLLAVPYGAVAAWIVQLWRFGGGGNWLAVPSSLLIGAAFLAVPATLRVMRTLERTAANELLGTALAEPAGPARPGDTARGAVWFLLHLASGALAVTVLVFVIPVLVGYVVAPFAGGLAVTGPLAAQVLPGTDPVTAVWLVLAASVAALGLLVVLASRLRTWAVLLLGPSRLEKLALAERQARELARRNGLARELHDSIGHALTVTTLQAAAARRLLAADPDKAEEAMAAVENAGRAAMEELDQVLGILRAPSGQADPVPHVLDEVPALLERHRAAGLRTTLQMAGDPSAVPASLARDSYRIIQEGLTNALKHGGHGLCEVSLAVTRGPDGGAVHIGISNPMPSASGRPAGRQPAEAAPQPGGRGLAGVKERVLLLGGRFHSGESGGRWHLDADLPWTTNEGIL
ncbi:histidine kinase [Pseudarthrobacter sp. J75]|uniref:sensor histidine kinase n=1 Tax=unclassified Pseudarthrobacter TaxID=2647000 RepID=UPI002E81E3A9|nr:MULTISPECIES: histidine kinase [unclassified Pseudarthrobacter]MEE2522684.1 histidine kinase [Pseudarthrobacter sp. J47]MEE2529545.1 histidine kinase [Pseudarthrobacter sp. J75]